MKKRTGFQIVRDTLSYNQSRLSNVDIRNLGRICEELLEVRNKKRLWVDVDWNLQDMRIKSISK